jgi:hypothetical protein
MNLRIGHIAAALLALAAGAVEARAAESRTWYVYCEGESADAHWAVLSENFWPHAETADYGRLVGSAARAFFESRHGLALDGCAGVNFRDDSLAVHSRNLTAELHRRMGDRVYFLPLPAEILSAGAESAPTVALPASGGAGPADQIASGGQAIEVRGWAPATAPR